MTCQYFAKTIRVHKNYVRVHIKKLVITRQVLDCRTQTLALVLLMNTQNPLVLVSTRGIFHGEYFLSTLWMSTFTRIIFNHSTDSSNENIHIFLALIFLKSLLELDGITLILFMGHPIIMAGMLKIDMNKTDEFATENRTRFKSNSPTRTG